MPKSVLPDKTLQEIRGVLKFVGRPVEERLALLAKPEPRPWTYPTHPMDDLGKVCSMSGWEIRELLDLAQVEARTNPMLQKALRDYVMIAKLLLSDKMEASRAKLRRIEEDKARGEQSYTNKLASYEGRKKSIINSWGSSVRALKAKWKYLNEGLFSAVDENPALSNFNWRDRVLLEELEKLGVVVVDGAVIDSYDMQAILDLKVNQINKVILNLESKTSPEGFLPKPVRAALKDIRLTDDNLIS